MPDPTADPIGGYWADAAAGGTSTSAADFNAREKFMAGRPSAIIFQPFAEPAVTGITPAIAAWDAGYVVGANLRVTGAPSGGSVTAVVRINGTAIGTLSVADGSTTPASFVTLQALAVNDTIDVNFTAVNGATGIVVQVLKKPPIALPASYASLITAESSLISAWGLAETSGTAAADRKAVHAGVYQGTPTLAQSALVFAGDGSVALNGTTQYVSVTGTVALQPASISAEAWINPTSVATQSVLNVADNCFGVGIGPGAVIRGFFWSGINRTCDGTTVLDIGTTYHIAAEWDNATKNLRVYVNGALENTTNVPAASIVYTSSVYTTGLGAGSTGTGKFNGRIDEPAIYNTALGATKWLAHYNRGLGLS